MRDGGIDFICQYIKDHNIKRILEIGTAIGFSASEFAKVSPDVTVTTIELDIDRHITAKQNFVDQGLDNRITAILGDAAQVALLKVLPLNYLQTVQCAHHTVFTYKVVFLMPMTRLLSLML